MLLRLELDFRLGNNAKLQFIGHANVNLNFELLPPQHAHWEESIAIANKLREKI